MNWQSIKNGLIDRLVIPNGELRDRYHRFKVGIKLHYSGMCSPAKVILAYTPEPYTEYGSPIKSSRLLPKIEK
jgi:hypothetical protein